MSLFEAGQTGGALFIVKCAEQLSRRVALSETRATANAWNQVGMVLSYAGFNREAKASYERGLALALKILPSGDVLLPNFQNNLGQVENRLGNVKAARDHLESALRIMMQMKQVKPSELAKVKDNLGLALQNVGELDQAETLHKQALEIFQQAEEPLFADVATALGNLGALYFRRQDHILAEKYQRRAYLIRENFFGPAHPETLLSAAHLVDTYLQSGDEVRADEFVNNLITIGDDAPSERHMNVAQLCSALASKALEQGQLGLSERLAARAVVLYRAAAGPTAPETLKATFLLANILAARGNFGGAEDRYVHLLNLYGPSNEANSNRVRIELGKMLRQRGKGYYGEAIKMFKHAIEDLREISPVDEESLASALGNLGQLYFEADEPKLAQEKYTEALALLKNEKKSPEHPWLLFNQAMLRYHLGDYTKASAGYEDAKAIWASTLSPDHAFVGTAAANAALVYWIQGDVDRALRSFGEANEIAERQAERTLTIGTESERLAYARSMRDDLDKVFSFCLARGECNGETARLAATMLLQRKGRVLDAMAQTMAQIRENLAPEERVLLDRLDMARSQISKLVGPLHPSHSTPEVRARVKVLKLEEDQLQSALSHKSALYRARLTPVTTKMVTDALPSNSLLVEYLKYSVFDPVRTGNGAPFPWRGERYAALVLRPGRAPQVFDVGAAAPIDEKVRAFRDTLQPGNLDPARGMVPPGAVPGNCCADASELYQLLVAPMRTMLSDARLLLIAPDAALNLIPFGLLTNTDGKRLSDTFVVNYLHSGRELLRKGSTEVAPPTIVVLANPDFDAKVATSSELTRSRIGDRGDFAALPGTHDEANAIEALFASPTRLEGPKATVEALKRLSRPGILHVATHGVFAPVANAQLDWKTEVISSGGETQFYSRIVPSALDNPMLHAGLVLAGANHADQSSQHSIITALEIANLDLRGTQLVVLSACDTGVGAIKQGEEFAGLRRAISIAGAAGQVTSLWKVDDRATQALMTEYYKLLLEGIGRAEALQLAQQRIEKNPRWSHPVYWAAFVPSGDWTPIESLARMRR